VDGWDNNRYYICYYVDHRSLPFKHPLSYKSGASGWLSLTDLSDTCVNQSIISFTMQSRYISIATNRLFHALEAPRCLFRISVIQAPLLPACTLTCILGNGKYVSLMPGPSLYTYRRSHANFEHPIMSPSYPAHLPPVWEPSVLKENISKKKD
jgi:hypothetical protein